MCGLSPRVRGNPPLTAQHRLTSRSIPARAGEPSRNPRRQSLPTVYPRACGGTYPPTSVDSPPTGLSPRVRGNPAASRPAATKPGSIPARAGEPWLRHPVHRIRRVYPRACGGTAPASTSSMRSMGLSPRVRGNLSRLLDGLVSLRSIPARAGEPQRAFVSEYLKEVYPRACGGTPAQTTIPLNPGGLSPRVRGNPIAGQ